MNSFIQKHIFFFKKIFTKIKLEIIAKVNQCSKIKGERLKMKNSGLYQSDACKNHPAISCGQSILDKFFAVEFRTHRDSVSVIIGDKCLLNNRIVFETTTGFVRIGDGCYISGGSKIITASSVEIGNWVTIAWGVTIYDHNSHSLDYRERIKDQEQQLIDWETGNFIKNKNWASVEKKPIIIKDYAWIGFDAVILKGVTIGDGAIIGARTVVTKDVEPWTVVAGNPARVVKRLEKANPQGDR